MSESQSVEDFYAQYDDLAIAVIDDERPNHHAGLHLSNSEMCEIVCELMEWEEFSLFDDAPFDKVYKQGSARQVLAYAYIAFLRWELFHAAIHQKVGDAAFNEKSCAHSELWYGKLRDRYDGIASGEMTDHRWLH